MPRGDAETRLHDFEVFGRASPRIRSAVSRSKGAFEVCLRILETDALGEDPFRSGKAGTTRCIAEHNQSLDGRVSTTAREHFHGFIGECAPGSKSFGSRQEPDIHQLSVR